MKKDYCSGFPDTWIKWVNPFRWKKVDISDICKDHDNEDGKGCASHIFAKRLFKNRIVGAIPIFMVASLACWVMYPIDMFKRI